MSITNRLVGAGAVLMALCCAVLPLAGGALGGALIAGAGPLGVMAGLAMLIAIAAIVIRRHRRRQSC